MTGVELVTAWLTPTVLFCILNLTIGAIFFISSLKPQKNQQKLGDNEQLVRVPSLFERVPSLFERAPSLFERVKSINLSSYRSEQPEPTHYEIQQQEQAHLKPEPEIQKINNHVTRSKSDAGARKLTPAPATVMKKYASEKVVENTASFGRGDEAVDAKADDFISRFRQQLKLQRLDSLLRYKEMLNRVVGK